MWSGWVLVLAVLYCLLLLVAGTLANLTLLLLIVRQKLYRDAVNLCVANILVVHTVQVNTIIFKMMSNIFTDCGSIYC